MSQLIKNPSSINQFDNKSGETLNLEDSTTFDQQAQDDDSDEPSSSDSSTSSSSASASVSSKSSTNSSH